LKKGEEKVPKGIGLRAWDTGLEGRRGKRKNKVPEAHPKS